MNSSGIYDIEGIEYKRSGISIMRVKQLIVNQAPEVDLVLCVCKRCRDVSNGNSIRPSPRSPLGTIIVICISGVPLS